MKKLTHCTVLWGIAVILLLSYIGAGVNSSAQAPEIGFGFLSNNSAYEYLVVDLKDKLKAGPTMEVLNSYGQQGWLVASVVATKGAYRYVLVRKRGSA